MDDKILRLREMIESSSRIVFFGGAGVSTESGIPDFRSADGIYMMNYKYPPEEIISRSFFERHPAEFFEFYKKYFYYPDAKPNITHLKLAQLEKEGNLAGIVTQNIDGLHSLAGNKKVYEIHGSVLRNYCMKCGRFYPIEHIIGSEGVPHCSCGGTVKPDVVLYEEPLDDETVRGAVNAIASADMLIVAGTSLRVYPAAGFIRYFTGTKSVLINREATAYDTDFSLIIKDSLGNVFSQL